MFFPSPFSVPVSEMSTAVWRWCTVLYCQNCSALNLGLSLFDSNYETLEGEPFCLRAGYLHSQSLYWIAAFSPIAFSGQCHVVHSDVYLSFQSCRASHRCTVTCLHHLSINHRRVRFRHKASVFSYVQS